jgi:hypothetical protein
LVVENKAITLSDVMGIILVLILGVVLLIKTLLANTKLGQMLRELLWKVKSRKPS